MSIIFCNVGWMKHYNGIVGDSIQRGGSYNNDEVGHEVCNFSDVDGKVYGYVQPTGQQIKLERLGASKNDSSIAGVTVIWTAGPDSGGTAVVGWYKNATVFREAQVIENPTELQKRNKLKYFRIIASASDVTLLPIDKRFFMIPRAVKGGIGQSNVWYADSPESEQIVAAIKKLLTSDTKIDSLPDLDGGLEGNPRLISHMMRERNTSIVKQKKNKVLEETGALKCEVCRFDFAQIYGKYGDNFCEVHHLIPLHKSDGLIKTELNDLAIVCSNCHRILHRINPMPSIAELVEIIDSNR